MSNTAAKPRPKPGGAACKSHAISPGLQKVSGSGRVDFLRRVNSIFWETRLKPAPVDNSGEIGAVGPLLLLQGFTYIFHASRLWISTPPGEKKAPKAATKGAGFCGKYRPKGGRWTKD